ncbi:hypothetical protein LMH87_010648 [Akanthomyces muscarius]|uniref:Cytochrome P450 n=1 Tax=Akanthomyces muscarius TaxID=2231603 RepID=A0A9W8UKB5_AKAMU|nr:hypothetical protein LMH87_010648 [Akanthomyces muscarius]KAJ4149870.1 hypothetical protein LMH87_010648 [Akanthomyces muscarius]
MATNPLAGYSALLTGIPTTDHLEGGGIDSRTFKTFKLLMTKARLIENLGQLVDDANSALGHLDTSRPFDPFNGIYLLIYQMTHRLLGSYDVADSPRLLAETLAVYDRMNDSSAGQTMFPMMPTLGMLRKLWAGARLHLLFRSMIRDRRKCGRRENDAMQIMMDKGDSDIQISTVIISSLFAGLLNSGVNAAWILCYLAKHRDWYMKVQAEVDEVIAAGRQSDDETPRQILERLTIEQWESSFPMLGYALQESIRLNLPGIFIRKNITNVNLPLVGTNIIVPRGSFAVYLADDVHLNQDLYPEPLEWNPCRHIQSSPDGRESSSLDYLGWGAGLHPCRKLHHLPNYL